MGGQTQILIEFSAHLLKSNYYQVVSIIFSNFLSMDLYQFTNGANTTVTEMVDVVNDAVTVLQFN